MTLALAADRPVRMEARVGEQKGCAHTFENAMPCLASLSRLGTEAGCPWIDDAPAFLRPAGPYCFARPSTSPGNMVVVMSSPMSSAMMSRMFGERCAAACAPD